MARQISVDISEGVTELIIQVVGCKEGTDSFNNIHKDILNKLRKSDTMYFLSKKEIDQEMDGMAEKFNFHGFLPEARALKDYYETYIPSGLPESALRNRLNIVKFLLCMSERPTSKFLEFPEKFMIKQDEKKEDFDWGVYLNEGIEKWCPNFDESSEYSTDSSLDDDVCDLPNSEQIVHPVITESKVPDTVWDLATSRAELLNTIQHTWYNQEQYFDKPFSDLREANIGILWENFLEEEAMGLITTQKPSVLSEYKVIREILWQLWSTHTSTVFKLEGNDLIVRSNLTISSIRAETFKTFLEKEFLPPINVLEFFRDFSKSLEVKPDDDIFLFPQTYLSYNNSLQNIMRPIYRKLSELEDKVREQENTYTLLNLTSDIRVLLEPVFLLQKIHKEVIIDLRKHSNLECATTLLVRLHKSLQYVKSKLEQDLKLTLYLDSLYYYFMIVDSWLNKNDLADYSEEFPIMNKNNPNVQIEDQIHDSSISETDICNLNFILNDNLDPDCKDDGIIQIICEKVLQIGRNLYLLRNLGKLSLLKKTKENIHEEFVRKALEEIALFFNINNTELKNDSDEIPREEVRYKFPVLSSASCKKPVEMDKLENLVDTSDGFLMLAFKEYFLDIPKQQKNKDELPQGLFEKISKLTLNFIPVGNFFENILNGILKERFTIPGSMITNLLIEQYLLVKQFQFLRHIFLFVDDLIFPFYRRFFEKANCQNINWGHTVRLTSHLQDIIADIYPEFYEKCFVRVDKNWWMCPGSLEACNMITIQYDIHWPLNIIINTRQMALYKDMFQFILKIKWGLYTLNHLSFTDLEPTGRRHKMKIQFFVNITMKLKYLKFVLTNLLYSIQHYIFSFVFTKSLRKFELDFPKANDLASIRASHDLFINTIAAKMMDVCHAGEDRSSLKNVVECIRALKAMWSKLESATPESLNSCYQLYKATNDAINPVICPKYI